MKYYRQEQKDIPIVNEVDVLVIGAGPAGFSAAINAARQGAKTMIVEQTGDVGGVATTGLMSHWTGDTKGGFYQEILERTAEDPNNPHLINPERLKTQLLTWLDEENVLIKLYSFAADVILEDKALKGVILESKSGREVVMAKVVIDASGDGDIAYKAGVPFVKGREEDGKMQPMTLMFKVAGVDTDRAVYLGGFEDTYETEKGELQALAKKHIPFPAGHVLLYKTTLPGTVTCNMTNIINVDGTNSNDLTKAHIECRKQIDKVVDFLKEFVPGYENCFLISVASYIGVRETRHFIGDYTINKEDILESKVFEDWIATKLRFNFDVHNISGCGLDETGVQRKFPNVQGYTIPYRCVVPNNIDQLLLAGRNISGTHMAHSNYRVMPICANMGQGVGVAAAICAQENIKPRDLHFSKIQEVLKKQGVTV